MSFGWSYRKWKKADGEMKTYQYAAIQLGMCDEDVVNQVAKWMGGQSVCRVHNHDKNADHRDYFTIRKQGKTAVKLMRDLWPWLGSYQRGRIAELLPKIPTDAPPFRNDEWLAGLLE